MKLIRITAVLATALICVSTFAQQIRWNPIPVAPATGTYYQQPPAPDYAKTVSDGFSKLAESLQQYQESRPTPKPVVEEITRRTHTDGSVTTCRISGGNRLCNTTGPELIATDAALQPRITYERQPDGRMAKCRTYGENSFCDAP